MVEMRNRLETSQREVKDMRRKLVQEVGEEGMQGGQEEGRRGRAQQISILKNKVRHLESELSKSRSGEGGSSSSYSSSSNSSSSFQNNNQSRAHQELAEMESERRRAVEELTEGYSELRDENGRLEEKVDKFKARVGVLEREKGRMKEKMLLLVEKGDVDNQLVDALREELSKLTNQLKKTASSSSTSPQGHPQSMIPRISNQGEVMKLKRENREQRKEIEKLGEMISHFEQEKNHHNQETEEDSIGGYDSEGGDDVVQYNGYYMEGGDYDEVNRFSPIEEENQF